MPRGDPVQVSGFVSHLPEPLLTSPLATRAVLTEIEEIRSGLWDEKIKASLGIVSPEPIHTAPAAQEAVEVEEPTNETEDVSMVDAEPPGGQGDPIVVNDSDATADEPIIAQQAALTPEEEEVDLHLTQNSVPPSPKPAEGADNAQEEIKTTNEELVQSVQKEATPHSPVTEQDFREQDPEGLFWVLSTFGSANPFQALT